MRKISKEEAEELIAAIEGFINSNHNYSEQLEEYAKECFENLMYNN